MQSNPIDPSESTPSPAERREDMRLALDQCRAGTLTLFEDLDRTDPDVLGDDGRGLGRPGLG